MKYVIFALALSGCAGRMIDATVSGNETYVSVSNVWNGASALPYAEKHCAKYGRIPKLQRTEGYSAIFDCVTPA